MSLDLDTLKSFGQIAAPAGLAIGAFLYIARDIVAKNIFPTLTKQHAYQVVVVLAFMAWTVALAGIATWAYVTTHSPAKPDTAVTQAAIAQAMLNDLSARDFDAVYARFDDRVKNELPPHKIAENWDKITNYLGPAKSLSKPILSTYEGRSAYVSTYQGTNGVASIFIAFDTHGDVDVLWFDWRP
jgi:hypothetical protein